MAQTTATKSGAGVQRPTNFPTTFPEINPTLESLKFLVGAWDVQITNTSFLPNRSDSLKGGLVCEWVENGACLAVRTSVTPGGPPQSVMVIGRDEGIPQFKVLYFDTRGVSRVYEMSVSDGVWTMWRQAPGFSQRFEGLLSADKRTVRAKWEKLQDGSAWEHDFDLIYTKKA